VLQSDPIRAGDITVFRIEGRDIPIVHRVIKVHETANGTVKFLTKGDNNSVGVPFAIVLTCCALLGQAPVLCTFTPIYVAGG
jgi:hypothetical protein